mgnify:CR=1 FL=1
MKSKSILVVDDEELVQAMLEEALSDLGYKVFLADNGKEALKTLESEKIQVMMFDLKMPGMNGVELCMEVKKLYPATVIYAMSGFHSLFELVDCLSAGFEDYFPKPFDFALIIQEIQHAFDKLERWKRI